MKIRRMGKSLRPMKIKRMVKSLQLLKIKRMVKSLRLLRIKRMVKSLRPEKIRRTIESLRALKSPRLVKNQRDWKSWRPAYCLGSAESPAADFLLVWLKSSRSDPLRCVVSLMQSPSEETAQAALLLWADSLPYCTGCLYRPTMLRNGQNHGIYQNHGGRLGFHCFQSNHSSLYLCLLAPYQRAEKTQVITFAVQYQLLHSRPLN